MWLIFIILLVALVLVAYPIVGGYLDKFDVETAGPVTKGTFNPRSGPVYIEIGNNDVNIKYDTSDRHLSETHIIPLYDNAGLPYVSQDRRDLRIPLAWQPSVYELLDKVWAEYTVTHEVPEGLYEQIKNNIEMEVFNGAKLPYPGLPIY